jgi:hypothetical protein
MKHVPVIRLVSSKRNQKDDLPKSLELMKSVQYTKRRLINIFGTKLNPVETINPILGCIPEVNQSLVRPCWEFPTFGKYLRKMW